MATVQTPNQMQQPQDAANQRKRKLWLSGIQARQLTLGLQQLLLDAEHVEVVADTLGLDADAVLLLQSIPLRGSIGNGIPTDPTKIGRASCRERV